MMEQHLNSSWVIMPQSQLLWTGDLNIDSSVAVLGILLVIIRMRK